MIGKSILGFLQIAVLARLLAPEDFGLMAVVIAITAFLQIFADLGVSNALIHHRRVSREELSSLYWLNVLAGVVLALLLIVIGPWIAEFYREPLLQPVLVLVSATFVLIALGQQLRVMAEKRLEFSTLAKIELAASAMGLVVAVSVALAGGGVYALVGGTLMSSAALAVLSWRYLALGWRPLFRLRLGETRKFLRFGAYMIGNNLANTLNLQADVLLGGRLLGASTLGAYSLPRELSLRLASVINPIVTRVGMPVMAAAQDDGALLKAVYLKTLRMTASINFPLYFALAVFAPEVVALIFGSQWEEAVPLLRVLAIWGAWRSTGNPAGSLIFAVGRADLAFKWNLALVFLMLPAVWVGSQYGSMGLALSVLVLSVLLSVPGWWVLIRPLCGAGFVEYYRQLVVPAAIAGVAALAGFIAASPFTMSAPRLGAGVLVGGVTYVSVSRWLNRLWFDAMWELLLGNFRTSLFRPMNQAIQSAARRK